MESIDNSNFERKEAIVARIYFTELFGANFVRFADDEINLALNYGYAMLRSKIKQIISAKGLIPALGIWHRSQSNNFNLSDDIIEVFRPMVDYITYLLIVKDNEFTNEERCYLQNVLFQKIKYKNRTYEFEECLIMYLDNIIKYMNKEQKTIAIPVTECRLYEY